MNTAWVEGAYEAMRDWALHPSPMRPSGVAQLLQGGIAHWVLSAVPLPDAGSVFQPEPAVVSPPTPLSTLVAAMIAQVFS